MLTPVPILLLTCPTVTKYAKMLNFMLLIFDIVPPEIKFDNKVSDTELHQ